MGLTRFVFVCALWLIGLAHGSNHDQLDYIPSHLVQDGAEESRGKHRMQLLFPLLLRISTRLATLVPTAMMALLGIYLFVLFSKKAFIVSLFALFLSIAHKFKSKDEIYIHKINSYPEYNDEEEHFYYHNWYPKGNSHHHRKRRKDLKKEFKPSSYLSSAIYFHVPHSREKKKTSESWEEPNFNRFLEENIQDPPPEPGPLSNNPEVLKSPPYSESHNVIESWSPITFE